MQTPLKATSATRPSEREQWAWAQLTTALYKISFTIGTTTIKKAASPPHPTGYKPLWGSSHPPVPQQQPHDHAAPLTVAVVAALAQTYPAPGSSPSLSRVRLGQARSPGAMAPLPRRRAAAQPAHLHGAGEEDPRVRRQLLHVEVHGGSETCRRLRRAPAVTATAAPPPFIVPIDALLDPRRGLLKGLRVTGAVSRL